MERLSQQLGTDVTQTSQAVGAALPLLLGALGRNTTQSQGAQELLGALRRDHAAPADPAGLLGSLLGGGGGAQSNGAAILGHIFGSAQQQRVETGLGQATGIGNQAGDLLKLLAPIVMSFLAQRVQTGGMDAGALGRTLEGERVQAEQRGGLSGGLLGSLLDQDGDGQVGLGDLVKIGGALFGARR